MLILLSITLLSFGQLHSEREALNALSQPDKSIRGDAISFTDGIYTPKHKSKTVVSCKGLVVNAPGKSGFVALHLTGDSTGKWFKAWVDSTSIPVLWEFDLVGNSTKGSTITFDTNFYIFPYKF